MKVSNGGGGERGGKEGAGGRDGRAEKCMEGHRADKTEGTTGRGRKCGMGEIYRGAEEGHNGRADDKERTDGSKMKETCRKNAWITRNARNGCCEQRGKDRTIGMKRKMEDGGDVK